MFELPKQIGRGIKKHRIKAMFLKQGQNIIDHKPQNSKEDD